MFSLLPSLDHPFLIDIHKANELRTSCMDLRSIVPLSKANDGGGKTKISSNNRFLWENSNAVAVAAPIFSFISSFISCKKLRNQIFFLSKSCAKLEHIDSKRSVKLIFSPINLPNRDDLSESQRNLLDATGNIENKCLRNEVIQCMNDKPGYFIPISSISCVLFRARSFHPSSS